MIFVTLGTQDKSFTRLLKAIDKSIDKKIIKEKVVVQSGYTKYKSRNMKILDYISKDDFEDYIKKASVIITHGGAGSILTCLKKGKKVIAVPRYSKYGEHTNDHQVQIVKELDSNGYILGCYDVKNIDDVYKKIKEFVPKKYENDNSLILNTINNYIEHNKRNYCFVYFVIFIIILILFILFGYRFL